MTEPVLATIGLTKRFPGVVANDGIDLALNAGEVHVLLGENGAGKSTLVAMLCGFLPPDDGVLLVDGRPVRLAAPRDALRLGIATVHQTITLAPTLTVAQNLALGAPWWSRPNPRAIARALARMRRDPGIAVAGERIAGELSLGEQQQVEIARALMTGGRVLILDEATSMLTPQGARDLGGLIRRLARAGLAVLFISHKLEEAFAFGDRVTVLRHGRKVGAIAPGRLRALTPQTAAAEMVTLMFGHGQHDAVRAPARRPAGRSPVLEVENLDVTPAGRDAGAVAVRGVTLSVAAGEILGIAGIDGNGQRELAEALAGQRPVAGGTIRLEGRPIERLPVGARRRHGLRYLSDDRHHEGTVGALSVALNLLTKEIGASPYWSRLGLERREEIGRHARERVRAFDVRTPSVATPVARLSGGNLQKVILARELTGAPRVAICAKPTHGLDVAGTAATQGRLRAAAEAGVAMLLLSTDLDELLALSHRVAVMSAGRIVGTVANGPSARGAIGDLMAGRTIGSGTHA